ncbi:MAG: Nramp family divalent metal transporter [Planctomycetaceae bacterium]
MANDDFATGASETGVPPASGGLKSIGPAIIVASVVLGPGSILTSSKVGHQYGYSMAWVLLLAGVLMTGMVALSGRLGATLQNTLCQELADRLGRRFAALIGVVMFLIVAAFQSSNNIAVVTAVEPLIGKSAAGDDRSWLPVLVLSLLNGVIILALYGLRRLYVPIERVMKLLVLVMIIGFMGNVIFARPSLLSLARGLIPHWPQSSEWLPLLGLIATTFSVGGAFYQSYLVREKGWNTSHLKQGFVDSAVGIAILCGTTMVIMMTSAAVLHGKSVELNSAADVGQQLEPLFGSGAKVLFSIGLLAGAISSFMVNAMVGGTVLADGFGLGWSMDQRWPKAFTVAALLFGMAVAVAATAFDVSRVGLIIFAQALTVVGVPLLAVSLVYLGTRPDLTGERKVPFWLIGTAILGTLVTLVLACKTVMTLYPKLAA